MDEEKFNETQIAVGALAKVQSSSCRQTAAEWAARHNFQMLLVLRASAQQTKNYK